MPSPPSPALVEAVRAALRREDVAMADEALLDLFATLPEDYLARERPEDVARHAALAATLGPGRRARVSVTPRGEGRFDVAVVAYDYFAELSMVCGLLAAHGLDIERGHAHTVDAAPAPAARTAGRGRGRPPAGRPRWIVDVFRVRPRSGSAPPAETLESELVALLDQVAAGQGREARESLNLRLVEAMEAAGPRGGPRSGPEDPELEIRFDDAADPSWTVLDVEGPDTPGLLYALTNALAMRGIEIHDVAIAGSEGRARDRFRISRAGGGPIADASERESLRFTVALIKRFTDLLPGTPDPARALRYFDQFLDRARALPPDALRVLSPPERLHDLARLLGSSVFLWEDVLRPRPGSLLPAVAGWRERPLGSRATWAAELRTALAAAPPDERPEALRRFRDDRALRVEVRRVLDPRFDLLAFSAALSDLAEALVEGLSEAAAVEVASRRGGAGAARGLGAPFAVFALGKFGGREIGYASDLELLFVYDDDAGPEAGVFFEDVVRTTQAWLQAPEGNLFHLDLRLRPHGGKGPLASPLRALRDYYRPGGGAAAFERQSLLKLRFVAGDPALGAAVLAARDAFVWSTEPWDREDAVRLRERQARELVPVGRFNVKLSPGGLVDAEYTVQYLQILHGREDAGLRTPSTLQALDHLLSSGRIGSEEHAGLREGYLFWRSVADALRIVRGHAGDLLLPDEGSDALGFLARRLGYPGGRAEAAAALDADVDRHRLALRAIYDARFRRR